MKVTLTVAHVNFCHKNVVDEKLSLLADFPLLCPRSGKF